MRYTALCTVTDLPLHCHYSPSVYHLVWSASALPPLVCASSACLVPVALQAERDKGLILLENLETENELLAVEVSD